MPNSNTLKTDKDALVIVTRKLPDAIEARMRELYNVRLNADDRPMNREELIIAVQQARVLVPTVSDKIDADVIAKAGDQLELIANFGNGTDNIDIKAASDRGILVSNTPKVLTDDTADMCMALIMAVPRRLVEGSQSFLQDEPWQGWSPMWMLGNRISGKKLGIIGMGRIGTAVAKRARAFGLCVHYHNRKPVLPSLEQELSATYWPDLDEMLSHVDIVSINCPSTPQTHHLLSRERIAKLKKGSYIVNTARGEVIDEAALIEALESEKVEGAGLDVFQHEPAVNPKLIQLAKAGKVVLIPHMSSATIEGRIEMGEKVMINIHSHLSGHNVRDRVLPTL